MKKGRIIIVILALFFGYRGGAILKFLGVLKEITYNDSNCELLGEDQLVGSEDLEILPNKNVIISSGDLLNSIHQVSNAKPGKLSLLDLSETPTISDLKIEGYPKQHMFQPHGIYLSQNSKVYVVNHVNDRDTIEVLKYKNDPPRLEYLHTLSNELFEFGVLNDVVEGDNENEIYVTRWLTFRLPVGGSHNNPSLFDKILANLETATLVLGIPTTSVYRCTWSDSNSKNPKTNCTIALNYQTGANGITKIPKTNTYFLVDLVSGSLGVLSRETDGSLERKSTIDLPHAVDNLMYNSFTHSLSLGTIFFAENVTKKFEGGEANVPGGMTEVLLPKDINVPITQENVQISDVIGHDGSKLSMISAGLRSGKYVVLGSPFSNGVLVCSPKKN